MIKARKIEEKKFEHFTPEGDSMEFLSYLEHLDLRIQIRNHQAEGYYLIAFDKKIRYDRNGNLEDYPDGMYDEMQNLLMELI